MRVVMRKNTDGAPGPCLQGFVGEAEDYLVNLTGTALRGFGANPITIAEVKAPTDSDRVNLSDLDYHARMSFPPCMKALH